MLPLVNLLLLSSLGLPLTSRRTTEKRSQAAADLEDIIAAFAKLDDNGSIPMIFCEASDLVLLPPIVTDPVCDSLVPRPRPAFRRLQYGKAVEGLE